HLARVALSIEPAPRRVAVVEAQLVGLAEHSHEAVAVGLAVYDPPRLGRREIATELDRDAPGEERQRDQTEQPSAPRHAADYCIGPRSVQPESPTSASRPNRFDARAKMAAVETFTAEERGALAPYFTNIDGPAFPLVNLPEVVKGALFARYSRSAKSLRRLFLDEFLGDLDISGDHSVDATIGLERAEELYEKVFFEYGDDSVAQLGGVHLACEQASKVLEWGRLMSYLEQSTRYIAYDSRIGGRYRFYRDPAVLSSRFGTRYVGD